jgi:hypothetical protein
MSESHDPWEAARGSQREEVQAIWAGRGAPVPRPPRWRHWRRMLAAVIGSLILVAVVAFVIVPPLQEDGDKDRKVAAAKQERLEADETARQIKEGIPVSAQGPERRAGESALAYRARLVEAGEAAITVNAHERVRTGELSGGEIKDTECRTFPFTQTRTDQESDLAIPRNRYQCTAYSSRFKLPVLEGERRTGLIGQPYYLVVDYASADLTFCKINPRAGEGGETLARVPVDPACRDPL